MQEELVYLIGNHELKKVEEELVKNAEVNCSDSEGKSYLHIAVINYDYEIVKLLIEKGAEIDCIDNKGNTPLKYALGKANEKSKKIAKYLIDKGADVDLKVGKYTAREMIMMFENVELMEYIKEK